MKKITIVADNHLGILADVTEIMALANINIEDIKMTSNASFALIALEVDKYDEALAALQKTNYTAYTEDVLLVKIEDRPGGLATVAKLFKDQGIDVKSIRIVRRGQSIVIIAIACDKMDLAKKVSRECDLTNGNLS